MKETILWYPVKTVSVSKGMKQRVELNCYLGYRRQLHRHRLAAKMFLCNFKLKVRQASQLQDWSQHNSDAKMSVLLIHQTLGFSAISWDTPLGNILMSLGILFGGGSLAKVLKIMGQMNIVSTGYSMKHQKKYLHAVERTYREQRSSLLDSIKAERKELILGGDGRCDSPGHSPKYGSYSLMDLEHNKILDSQLVQVSI